ncbi:MAG TPA: NUDIX hydrolase [Acidimicrobiales bacterium]|nr:NUDIX hydrolase [Acidimicrobiales bacterium]
MTEYPISDADGRSLLSLELVSGGSFEDLNGSVLADCALVVVQWDNRVLLGCNVDRQLWELPGGTVEVGESAHDAATRELAEETGIHVDAVSLVAQAAFTFGDVATRYVAAVFLVVVGDAPDLVESDELHSFVWWDPNDDLFEGQGLLDAVVARHCLLNR